MGPLGRQLGSQERTESILSEGGSAHGGATRTGRKRVFGGGEANRKWLENLTENMIHLDFTISNRVRV